MPARRTPFRMLWARTPGAGGGAGARTLSSGNNPFLTTLGTTIDVASNNIYLTSQSYAALNNPLTVIGYDLDTLAETTQYAWYDNNANPLTTGNVTIRDGNELITVTSQTSEIFRTDLAGNVLVGPIRYPNLGSFALYNGLIKIIGSTLYFGGRYVNGSSSGNWHGAYFTFNKNTLAHTGTYYNAATSNAMAHHRDDPQNSNRVIGTETNRGIVKIDLSTGQYINGAFINLAGSNWTPGAFAPDSTGKVFSAFNRTPVFLGPAESHFTVMDSTYTSVTGQRTIPEDTIAPIELYPFSPRSAIADGNDNWYCVGPTNALGGFNPQGTGSAIMKFSNDLSTFEAYEIDHIHFVEVKYEPTKDRLYISCNFYDTDNTTGLGMGVISIDASNFSGINGTGPNCVSGQTFQPYTPTFTTPTARTIVNTGSLTLTATTPTMITGTLGAVPDTFTTTNCPLV